MTRFSSFWGRLILLITQQICNLMEFLYRTLQLVVRFILPTDEPTNQLRNIAASIGGQLSCFHPLQGFVQLSFLSVVHETLR
ncbi:hypothetical protein ASF71_20840 [Deinococcus sp. Leaf326]|nr:hypothetical protein ASF71_20840 [Deinococcus sp. Leaf326]